MGARLQEALGQHADFYFIFIYRRCICYSFYIYGWTSFTIDLTSTIVQGALCVLYIYKIGLGHAFARLVDLGSLSVAEVL